jgi:hypothetical protein
MKKIGGFFELELTSGDSIYHNDAISLSTGRACLNYILQSKKPTKVYVPYYCCDALIEPLSLNEIDYEFYSINDNLELTRIPELQSGECIIYCDFFGIKSNYTLSLIEIFQEKLIVDNTHSFFSRKSTFPASSFTSARKYFGVPDGAFLYIPEIERLKISIPRNQKISIDHNVHSLVGLQDQAYLEYAQYESELGSEIETMSILSERLLSNVNFDEVRKIRNDNFEFLRNELGDLNELIIDKNEVDCFCYPLLLKKPIDKQKLYNEKIFIPSLWLDTVHRDEHLNFPFECKLSRELLPLPIDHRYTSKELQRVSNTIKRLIHE